MSFNTVMVQLDVDDTVEPRLEFALALCRQFDADLIAFAAAEARMVVPAGDSAMLAAEALRHQVEQIEGQLEALHRDFQHHTANNPRVSWRGSVGNPTQLLTGHARAADLLIVGSPAPEILSDHKRTLDHGSLIVSAGRPILVASDDLVPMRPENAVVAWKDTREARRAVCDALPFLMRAQNVLVLSIADEKDRAASESADDVMRFLIKHGVKASSEIMDVGKSRACDALAQAACEFGADLIVSGAYGHSRLREWALGGVTRSLLRENGVHRFMSN